jgi:hypothetical protein
VRQDAAGTAVPGRGAREHREPGVLVAFEESAEKLAANVASWPGRGCVKSRTRAL